MNSRASNARPETDTFEDAASTPLPDVLPVRPYLFIVLECDRPSAGGARYALTNVDEIVIGRGAERRATRETVAGVNQLTLKMPGKSMSATHARIVRSEGGWALEDLRSTNGSNVNRRRVDRAPLEEGDVIELGHTIFMLQNAVATPPSTAEDFDSRDTPPLAPGMATMCPQLGRELALAAQVAQSPLPLLLLGDTGTGKEVLARAIHRLSGRDGPFVAVNCGAIPPGLVEGHLFGHVRGAFTGATRDELGFVRSASQGTLLLDEIGDLPMSAQPALLRLLQEGEVVPVGSSRASQVDVRIIAATHRPLDSLAHAGRFRHDLLARLDAYRIELPPLARRLVDIGCIVGESWDEQWGEACRLSPDAGVALAMHGWPFNIRELVAAVRRGSVLARGGTIEAHHLGLPRPPARTRIDVPRRAPALSVPEIALRNQLVFQLEEAQGNIAEVARAMGKARMQVHRWLKRFGIEPSSFRRTAKPAL